MGDNRNRWFPQRIDGSRVLTITITAPQQGAQQAAGVAEVPPARRREPEQHLQQRDQAPAVRMQEAEVACPAKALGQHVLQDEPEEIGAG